MTSIYDAAIYYTQELKLSVVPIVKGQKRPAIKWTEYQSRIPDASEIYEWFHERDYQIGVVCGAVSGGLVVLDFETPTAYNEWAGRHPWIAQNTRTVQTGKGFHVYAKIPPEDLKGNQKLIPNLVETRAEGGQVLAPPSMHPSGRHYKLYGTCRDIARVQWAELSNGEKWQNGNGEKKQRLSAKDAAATVAFGVKAGDRNDSIFNAAVIIRDTGAPQAQAFAVLYAANEKNEPPLDKSEIKRTVESAYSKKAKGKQTEEQSASSFEKIMARVKKLREEQTRGWMEQISNPDAPTPNFANKCRLLMAEAGALTELQAQDVVAEIMREPPLSPRGQTALLRTWRLANKKIRDAIKGKATDDEIASAFKARYDGERMYTRSRWYQWEQAGVWTDHADVTDDLWQLMVEFKDLDLKPSKNKRVSIEECCQGRSFLGVHESRVDNLPESVNVMNGVYNFVDESLTPHAPEQYLTTQLPFDYEPDAGCPKWKKFLGEVFVDAQGNPNENMIEFMQQCFGYSLTTWTKYELSFWLQGGGANGKSTLIHVLSKLSGTASMALNLGMLERDPYQLALLPGIRVVTCTESPVGLKVADAVIKSLVSGDVLNVRMPYGKPFELIPQCKLWWAMNNFPRVADNSEGFWRKVKVVPFSAQFYGKDRNENLRPELEAELSGIFNWAVEGLRSLIADGWLQCEAVEKATELYRQSNDVERVFVTEMCLEGEGYVVRAKALYKEYKSWCIDTSHHPKTMTRVSGDWVRLGLQQCRDGAGVFYRGLTLKSTATPPSPQDVYFD